MDSQIDQLSSFDLYVKHRPGQVHEVNTLNDVCSGMNPCYYLRDGGKLKASSSVVALILDSGKFERNPRFKPPKFIMHPWQRNAVDFVRNGINAVEKGLRHTPILQNPAVKKIKSMAPQEMKNFLWDPHYSAHISNDSIDSRINKLRPFESVSAERNSMLLTPDYSLADIDEYLEKSAFLMRRTINEIEAAFPQKKQIVLMGGKDSQLISLVPKLNEENWYVFSAEPNHSLIKEWVAQNKIHATKIFAHDGKNEERMADFKRKVMCSDLYTNPIHVRYLPTLERIVNDFDGECMFWLGSMPRRASLYDASHRKPEAPISNEQFFNVHMNTFPGWQGNIQQTYANYLGCPFLSPYYLKDMWFELYAHLDPSIIVSGQDYRPRLGELLAGRKIVWPTENPGPSPYEYWYFWFSPYRHYLRQIDKTLAKHADQRHV
jgi:hypothetical protein